VTVSNKKTFTDPVFNFSATFEFIWEELTIPISHDSDWILAEKIMLEEARAVSRSEGAQEAMELMLKRYPVPRVEVEPHVFVRATDNWMELAARFIVPVRTARSVKDGLSRRITQRLDEAGIEIASETIDATVHGPRDGGGSRRTS
jgi:small-conductance mechanosensitive channel